MRNKKTKVISSIAACAVIVSFFAFGSHADVLQNKAADVNKPATQATALYAEAGRAQSPAPMEVKAVYKVFTGTSAINGMINKFSKKCPITNAIRISNNQQQVFSKPVSCKPSASNPSKSSKKPVTKPVKATPKPVPGKTSGDFSTYQKKVLELVNNERAKAGLKPLKLNAGLNRTATLKSQDMAKNNYFDHYSPTYGSPFDMMRTYGISYRAAGENIAMGQTSPEQVMQGWMNSPGHRANILNASFKEIGVGIARNSAGRLYWTQQFIG